MQILAGEPGLINYEQTGMPETLWIDESVEPMAHLMMQTETAKIPSINNLRLKLDLSQSEPALSPENSNKLGAGRLDYLLNIGAIDAAEALAKLYSWESDVLRKRVEEIALLSTRSDEYCEGLLNDSYQEIQNGMKIYCQIRSGEWDAAVEEFKQTEEMLSSERAMLLRRFLDLDNEEDPLRDQAWITLPTPFDFVLDEAIGRPRGLKHLPPSYAYFSREIGVTPRTDLEITEELVHLGALQSSILFAAYRANPSAESGGAWGRAQVVQWLDELSLNPNEAEVSRILNAARERFRANGLEQLFAQEAKDKLEDISIDDFEFESTKQAFIRLGVLGGWSQPEWQNKIGKNEPSLMLAFLLSQPDLTLNPNQIFSTRNLDRIVKNAFFSGEFAPLEASAFGDAIWQSLYVIDNYQLHAEHQVQGAFQTLFISGLEKDARKIAIALLLEDTSL